MADLGLRTRAVHRLAELLGNVGLRRWLLRRPLPPRHETLAVPGCFQPIDIAIDTWGVPHIRAATAADLFFAQGYCHARDRLWQLELNRRIARGELAEVFGMRALEIDRCLRRLGFRRAAEAEVATLADEGHLVLNAYAAGINAYAERHRLPIEFSLLRQRPRPWQPIDSLAFARYMGWSLMVNWEMELIRARLRAALGAEAAAALEPEVGASNAWVVATARSATGRPLLANDPHLRPRMPAAWYVAHLQGAGYDVAGATLPGMPGVLIGHNANVAWGITAGLADCQDLFEEKRDPARPRHFAFGADWYAAQVLHETIEVRGQANPVVEEVILTRHGPLLNGVLDIPTTDVPLALQDAAANLPSSLLAILALNQARDATRFRTALAEWTFPVLNFVYADVAGDIGYQLAGRVPIRAQGDGERPAPGWSGTHEWVGMVPFADMPHVANPDEGILSTANNRPEVPCRHYLGRSWHDPNRQHRILELLRARSQHTVADFQAMQGDVVSLPARSVAQRLCSQLGDQHPVRPLLAEWDGCLAADSVAATIYEVFRQELPLHIHRGLPATERDLVLGVGICEALAFGSNFHGRSSSFLQAWLEQLSANGQADVIRAAVDASLAWLGSRFGPDMSRWQWGRLHRVTFGHVLGLGAPMLDRLLRLSRGPFSLGGDLDTIAQSGVDPWHPYDAATFTVSYRQLVDVGNWDEMRFILPTGQSGQPGSPHYDDMLEAWRQVEYRPLLFTRTAVERATAESIRLRPACLT